MGVQEKFKKHAWGWWLCVCRRYSVLRDRDLCEGHVTVSLLLRSAAVLLEISLCGHRCCVFTATWAGSGLVCLEKNMMNFEVLFVPLPSEVSSAHVAILRFPDFVCFVMPPCKNENSLSVPRGPRLLSSSPLQGGRTFVGDVCDVVAKVHKPAVTFPFRLGTA